MLINPYRKSVSPFVRPLPVPICDPDFEPVTLAVSCRWLSYILGALSLLQEQATWDTTDPDEMLLAIQRVANLRDIFVAAGNDSACDELTPPYACFFDFEIDEQNWTLVPGQEQGTYVPGFGWQGQHLSSISQCATSIQLEFDGLATITHAQIVYASEAPGSGANNTVGCYVDTGSGYFAVALGTLEAGTNVGFNFDGEISGVQRIQFQMNSGTEPDTTFIRSASVDGFASVDNSCP